MCINECVAMTTTQEDQEGERWADMVEKMLWVEREKDAQQTSTVKLVERECLLEEELENHTP